MQDATDHNDKFEFSRLADQWIRLEPNTIVLVLDTYRFTLAGNEVRVMSGSHYGEEVFINEKDAYFEPFNGQVPDTQKTTPEQNKTQVTASELSDTSSGGSSGDSISQTAPPSLPASSGQYRVNIRCGPKDKDRLLFNDAATIHIVGHVPCDEAVDVIGSGAETFQIRRADGQTGYVLTDAVTEPSSPRKPSQPSPP